MCQRIADTVEALEGSRVEELKADASCVESLTSVPIPQSGIGPGRELQNLFRAIGRRRAGESFFWRGAGLRVAALDLDGAFEVGAVFDHDARGGQVADH